ncbi:hypothetical protein [Halovenus sp. HT40]|uniref:hypothetical protein n=1 Tax=Halovenus sp. HT40 TaxID=3126691 RepID=UPI00300F5A2C
MAARALLATRNGPLTPGFEAVVSALGYEVVDVLATDGPEDNQYYLPPGLVEKLRSRIAGTGAEYLAIDGIAHEGQIVDLDTAFPSVTIRDRRDVVAERLASGDNPAAEAQLALRERQIELRRARRDQREQSTTGPSGTSGTVSELDGACKRQAMTLANQQKTQRRRIIESYEGTDTHVAVVGQITAPTTTCWEALTGEQGESGPLRPATPTTALTEIGSHAVAVTDTPGSIAGESERLAEVMPGTAAAIDRADILLVVSWSADRDIDALLSVDEFQGAVVQCPEPADAGGVSDRPSDWGEQISDAIRAALPTTRIGVALPYSDEGHALVSTLHEETTVETIWYEDEIRLLVEMPDSAVETLGRRIEAVDGEWIEEN